MSTKNGNGTQRPNLMAMYWWIDRWRKSSAFMDLTLEEQGAYRNLLEESWLRGGELPNRERLLAKASGDAMRWPKLRANVMKHFQLVERRAWTNPTLIEVLHQSTRRAKNQRAYRERVKARTR